MNKFHLALAVLAFIAIASFAWLKLWSGALPPHEFAYGASLANLQDLPRTVSQFLALEMFDPTKARIEVSILGGNPGTSKNVEALADYFRAKLGSQPEGDSLVSELRRVNDISDVGGKFDALLKTLIQHKDLIRDEANQDKIIVFIYYRLRLPSSLSSEARDGILPMVKKLDTDRQVRLFDSSRCPTNFLEGNINIYPLAMENAAWRKSIGFPGDPSWPILEIRFMGLRGIFRYVLDAMEQRTGLSFVHLDGEELSIASK